MNSNNDVDMAAARDHVLGGAGAIARHRRGPVGVPACRHRLPRAPLRLAPRHASADTPADRARRPRRARPGRASASTTSRSSTSTPASRLRCSSARRHSGSASTASSPGQAACLRRRPVEQLRDARHRHRHGRPARAARRAGLVWANGGYVTKHSFGVYAHRAARRRVPPRRIRRTRSTPSRARRLADRRRGRTGRRRGLHGHARARRRARSRRSPRASSTTGAGRGALSDDADVDGRARARASGSAAVSTSTPTAAQPAA